MGVVKYLFLFLSYSFIYSQSSGIEVNYKTISNYNIDELKKDPSVSKIKLDYAIRLKENYEDMAYILKASIEESIFETIIHMQIDSRVNPIAKIQRDQRFYVSKKETIEQKSFMGEDLLISEDSFKQNWEFETGTMNILGQECRKATLTYQEANQEFYIVAWFAPNINYNFGPKGYHGLPGLILRLERNKVLIFEATSIKEKDNLVIAKPTTGKKISRKMVNERMLATIKNMNQQ